MPVTFRHTAAWTRLSGPVTFTFGSPNALTTTATFSADGVYRLQLVASKGGYTLTEPYDFTIVRNPVTPPTPVAPAVTVNPVSVTRTLGGSATFSVTATGDGPLVYLWRLNGVPYWPVSPTASLVLTNLGGGLAGTYDCVVTGPGGSATSATATLTIADADAVIAGGLWRQKYSGIPGSAVSDLTASPEFPRVPDSSSAITSGEDPNAGAGGDSYGQRWTGWLKPAVTGDSKFYLTADNSAELGLSGSDQPSGRGRIVSLPSSVSARQWSTGGRSGSIPLVAGQRYYLELLHKNSDGSDHAAFTWQRPGDPVPADGSAAIGSAFLEYRRGGEYSDPVLPPCPSTRAPSRSTPARRRRSPRSRWAARRSRINGNPTT